MGISQQLGHATEQSLSCEPGGCKACQRKGLPLLPLRRAVAPAVGSKLSEDKLTGIEWREDTLRTLRSGYLYLLLDDDIWLGYQVTPEGALRQFNPVEPPLGDIEPLTQQCVGANHDVPASFINVPEKYKKAHVAFANDVWSRSVLDAYKRTKAPAPRFTVYDLGKLRENPAAEADAGALTQASDLTAKVWEYSPASKDFDSVHGFHSRAHRADTMATWAQNASQLYRLKHGVPVLVLPDPVGMVQEYNSLRIRWTKARAAWMVSADRPYQLFTSQALLGIKELEAQWAANEAKAEAEQKAKDTDAYNASPMGEKAGRYPVNIPVETERLTKSKTKDLHDRLGERYDESLRKTFQDAYDKGMADYQAKIDAIDARYEQQWSAKPFQIAANGDYANVGTGKSSPHDDIISSLMYIRMLALCLTGGPSGARPRKDKDKAQEATQRLWKTLLDDSNSLLYRALLGRDQNLLQLIQGDLSGDSKGKLYDTTKTLIGSAQGQAAMVKPVQDAIGLLLSATASACNALADQLKPATLQLVGHLHSTALLRYAGQRITELHITLSVGDYLTLLSEALHERAKHVLDKLEGTTQRHVRAMVMSGALAIASARNNGTVVTITTWVLESAESAKASVQSMQGSLRTGAQQARRMVSVGAATLERGAAQVMHAMELGATEARQLARDSLRRLRTAGSGLGVNAPDLLLSLGSLWFQQDSLGKNLDAISKAPGAGHNEAVAAAWSSSIGVMAGGAELTGITLKALYPEITVTAKVVSKTGLGLESALMPLGARLVQFAGAAAAVTGIVDGAGYAFAAQRARSTGDTSSSNWYVGATALSVGSAVAGMIAAFTPEAALLGPLGIALVLGLLAYGIALWAKSKESTPLELWARHTLWGLPKNYRQWDLYHDRYERLSTSERAALVVDFHNSAIAALNAAVLGLIGEAGIHWSPRVISSGVSMPGPLGSSVGGETATLGPSLQYAIALPGYDASAAQYTWRLSVVRYNGSQVIAAGSHNDDAQRTQGPPRNLDYNPGSAQPIVKQEGSKPPYTLSITGSIELNYGHDITGLKLEVSYRPDKSDEEGVAELTLIENKLDEQRAK